jgi:hypothetical protein
MLSLQSLKIKISRHPQNSTHKLKGSGFFTIGNLRDLKSLPDELLGNRGSVDVEMSGMHLPV